MYLLPLYCMFLFGLNLGVRCAFLPFLARLSAIILDSSISGVLYMMVSGHCTVYTLCERLKRNQHPNISLLRENIITETMRFFLSLSSLFVSFKLILSTVMRRTRIVHINVCSMWWVPKCDLNGAQINNKQKIQNGWKQITASIDLLTLTLAHS